MLLDSFLFQICLDNLLFLFFSVVLAGSALAIIVSNNAIHSVLFLVLNFVTASCLLFLLECEFLALLFIIIYVGAIAVLFLFVVMMLDVKEINNSKDLFKYLPVGSIIGVLFFVEVVSSIINTFEPNPYSSTKVGLGSINTYYNWYTKIDILTDINSIGQILYTHYLFQFLIAGFILLLAVIGSVVLTMNNNTQKTKTQVFFKQISRNSRNILLV